MYFFFKEVIQVKRLSAVLILLAVILVAATSAFAAEQKTFDWTYNTMIRYEAHTADDPPNSNAGLNDDFFITMYSMTGAMTKHVLANFYVGYKLTVEANEREANMFGANYIMNHPTYRLTIGYSMNDTDYASQRSDTDRLSINLVKPVRLCHNCKNSSINLNTTLAARTNWSDDRTLNQKIEFPFKHRKNGSGNVSYTYGYNFVSDGQIYNQYNVAYNYALSKRTRISADYLFIGRVDSFNVGGVTYEPDDDNVFRFTWSRTM